MSTIADLEPAVLRKVDNRTADTTLADEWIRDAILELASNPDYRDDFIELEVTGPAFALTIGTQEYADSNLMPATTVCDATLDIRLWTDYPSNTIARKLIPNHYQEIDKLQTAINSTPIEWYRFGSKIGFYPKPDAAYQVQARALKQHPIAATISTTTILLPTDWNEIIVYAAAVRGYNDLGDFDKAQYLRNMLYGDPQHPELPGLIKGRKKLRAREAWRSNEANRFRPRIRRVSYFRG